MLAIVAALRTIGLPSRLVTQVIANLTGKPFCLLAVITVKTSGKKQYPLIFDPLPF
jgi:hypothetical protein